MPMTLLSAVLVSFFLVRVIKGPWARHPHYLSLAMIGSVAATIVLTRISPGMEDDFIAGNAATFFGAIALYDMAKGA